MLIAWHGEIACNTMCCIRCVYVLCVHMAPLYFTSIFLHLCSMSIYFSLLYSIQQPRTHSIHHLPRPPPPSKCLLIFPSHSGSFIPSPVWLYNHVSRIVQYESNTGAVSTVIECDKERTDNQKSDRPVGREREREWGKIAGVERWKNKMKQKTHIRQMGENIHTERIFVRSHVWNDANKMGKGWNKRDKRLSQTKLSQTVDIPKMCEKTHDIDSWGERERERERAKPKFKKVMIQNVYE